MFTGPNIPKSDLSLQIDVANFKYNPDIISQSDVDSQNHGLSDWYCFSSGTVTYAAIYPHTTIYEVDSVGNKVEKVAASSTPKRGTFVITAGRRYYATKPIHLMVMNGQDKIVPISLKGNKFGHISNRGGVTTYNCYCPEGSGIVYMYENVVGGVTGTATASQAINAGQHITFTSTDDTVVPIFFSSTVDIIMSAIEANINDKVIIPPASTNVYKRRNQYNYTINNTTPSTINAIYTSDSLPCFTVEIADGAGNEATQGLGLEYLSNTYAFGGDLSDYKVVAPYPNTKIRILYYQNGWKLGDTHELNGTQTSPDSHFRSGDLGFGVEASATEDDGASPHLGNNANLWKWESNQPFALIINDSTADEELMLGWMKDKTHRGVFKNQMDSSQYIDVKGAPTISTTHKGVMVFDGVDDYLDTGISTDLPNLPLGFSVMMFVDNLSPGNHYLASQQYASPYSSNWILGYPNGGLWVRGATVDGQNLINDGNPHSIAMTYDGSVGKLYIDGELIGQVNGAKNTTMSTVKLMTQGDANGNFVSGDMGVFRLYERVLTAKEIKRNHRANKSRFKI